MTQFARFEVSHAIDSGYRASKQIISVFSFLGYLDSTLGDPAVDPRRTDADLLGDLTPVLRS